MLPIKYRKLCHHHIDKLWEVWRGLGIYSEGPIAAMSLEEAFLGLCIFGRYDQRLFDEALSIVVTYPGLLNKNKIKRLFLNADNDTLKVLSVISLLLSSKYSHTILHPIKISDIQKQPDSSEAFFLAIDGKPFVTPRNIDTIFLHTGYKRNTFILSDTVPQLSTIAQLNPWIKAKLIYGNSVRADVIVHLIIESTTAPDIARKDGYAQKSVWNVLDDLVNAGLVSTTPDQNKLIYKFTKNGLLHFSQLHPGKQFHSLWKEWKRIGHYLYHIRNLPEDASPSLIVSEEKRVAMLLEKDR